MNIGKGSEAFTQFRSRNTTRLDVDTYLSDVSKQRDNNILQICDQFVFSDNTTNMFALLDYSKNVSMLVNEFRGDNKKANAFMEANETTTNSIVAKVIAFIKMIIEKIKAYFSKVVEEFDDYQTKFKRVVDELYSIDRTPLTSEQLNVVSDVAVLPPVFIQNVSKLLAAEMPTSQSVKAMYSALNTAPPTNASTDTYEGSVSTDGTRFTINTEKLNEMVRRYQKFKQSYEAETSSHGNTTFGSVSEYHSVAGIMSSIYKVSDISSQVNAFKTYVKDVIAVFTALTNKHVAIDYDSTTPSNDAAEVQKSMQLVIAFMKLIDHSLNTLYNSMIRVGLLYLKAKRSDAQPTNP